jgi:hypothetical protein
MYVIAFNCVDITSLINSCDKKLEEETRYTGLPKLADSLVNITLVDLRGKRYPLVGREGETLVQASMGAGLTLLDDDSMAGGNPMEVGCLSIL